jgi:uncharacterized damage-inducible protein DinB
MKTVQLETPIELHLRYLQWAAKRIGRTCQSLPREALDRPMNVSHRSVLGTIRHIIEVDTVWLGRAAPAVVASRVRAVISVENALDEWIDTTALWIDWAKGTHDIHRLVSYTNSKGHGYAMPLWQIVLHLVNHDSYHRGQIVAMLRQVNVQPPSTDLIAYYRDTEGDG